MLILHIQSNLARTKMRSGGGARTIIGRHFGARVVAYKKRVGVCAYAAGQSPRILLRCVQSAVRILSGRSQDV